jgi:O-antigen/teichoic acid export membrane protein
MNGYLKDSFAEITWSVILKVFQIASGFITSVMLIRYLTVEEYGSFRFIYSLTAIVAYISSCGIEGTLLRFVPEFIEKKQLRNCASLLFLAVATRVSVLIGLLGSALLCQNFLIESYNFSNHLRDLYTSVCLFIFLSQTHGVFGLTFLSACFEQRKSSAIECAAMLIRLISIGSVIYLDLGFQGIISYMVLIEGFLFLTYALFAIEKSHKYKKHEINKGKLPRLNYSRIIKFSAYSSLLSLTAVTRELAVDNMVIAHYLDITHVAIYSFAISIVELLSNMNPSMFLKNIVTHIFVRKYTANESLDFLDFGNQFLIKLAGFFMLPIYISISILMHPIIVLIFKSDYTAAIPIVNCLMVFFFINNVLAYGISHILFTLELNKYRVIGSLLTGIINLILDIILVPYMSLMGAAIATSISGLLLLIYYYAIAHYSTKLSLTFPWQGMLKILFHGIVVGLVLIIARPYIENTFSLALSTIAAAMLYLSLSYINKPFSERERELINKISKRNIWPF